MLGRAEEGGSVIRFIPCFLVGILSAFSVSADAWADEPTPQVNLLAQGTVKAHFLCTNADFVLAP